MKLSKIDITHFRCFESLSVTFQPDINVIVGANGAGKSSILDALAIALYEVVAANGVGSQRQRKDQGAALLATDIHRVTVARESTKSFVQVKAAASDFYPVERFSGKTPSGAPAVLEWSQNITYQPPARFGYSNATTERLSELHQYIQALWREIGKTPQALIPLPVFAYYRATRRMGGTPDLGDIFKQDLSRDKAFVNALDAATNFTAMCQWFYLRENAELRAKSSSHPDSDSEYADIRAVRKALSIMVEGLERVYFDGTPPRLMVDLRLAGNEIQTLELAQLSDGYRNLLAIALDFARRLAQANPNWSNPLEAPGILLIDEVELHLHPRWQQMVIPALRAAFPNTQLIVTTHSPAVLSTVRREHLHLLSADHQFESLPEDVGTFGADTSRVLAEVFGTHARPPKIETVAKLNAYLGLVESRQHTSADALALRSELESALGRSDPDLQRADLRIRQIEVLSKRTST
jgi:predicted ATP-binding protein involved in virulence